jgi:hypothetical protein
VLQQDLARRGAREKISGFALARDLIDLTYDDQNRLIDFVMLDR